MPLALLSLPAASHAAVVLKSVTAQAITDASLCTGEPKAAYYPNTAYNPLLPTKWFGAENLPSTDDLIGATQAGAASDFCVGYALTPDFDPGINRFGLNDHATYGTDDPATHFDTGDDQRDIIVDLPAGYAGNLKNAGTCTTEQFGKDGLDFPGSDTLEAVPTPANGFASCPQDSQIGEAVVRISTAVLSAHTPVGGPSEDVAFPDQGMIFNLDHGPNELGRLGVQIMAPLAQELPSKFIVRLTLAPDGSGRVRAIVRDAPRTEYYSGAVTPSPALDIYIESVSMRMWGAKAAHPRLAADFGETGTSCGAGGAGTVDLTTYGGSRTTAPANLAPVNSRLSSVGQTLTGCSQVPFSPSVSVIASEHRPGVPTGVDVSVNVDQAPVGGILPSTLKDATVTLPSGLELGAQVATGAGGLKLCSAAQFGAAQALVPNTCPGATEAGTVRIDSPLITDPLVGKVYLGEQSAVGQLPALYVEAAIAGATAADAPRIKLVGQVSASADGKLTTTFLNNPQLRFSTLKLSFPAGDHALFVTPQRCGTTQGSADLAPWSGRAVSTVSSSLVIDQGCDVPFAPTVKVSSADGKVSSKGAQKISLERPDRAPWVTGTSIHLPSGFLADLNAAKECPAASAATGTCADDTRIGTVATTAGAGASPLALSGKLFLTERKGSDVAGAVIVVPAKIGDLDLGTVVVPGRILLRATDAGLDFITDIPTRQDGVALQLRTVGVTLDRPGFPLAPSACGPLAYSAEMTGTAGATATPSGQVTYAGCKDRPFAPKLKAILTGDNTPGGHPGMYVVLTSPEGDSGLKTAAVTLPEGVTTDGLNIKNACSPAAFAASSCPAGTRIGSATASVSIVPDPLVGDIYLVTVAGKALPGLGLDFKGRYAQRVLGNTTTDKQSRIVTTFPTIPDLPLRKLVIDVASGPKAPLLMSENEPCANGSSWQGVFTGQGDQSSTSTTGLQCAATPKTTLSTKAGLSLRLFDFGTRKLQYLKLTLPKGWSFNAKAAKKADGTWVRLTGGSGTIKLGKRALVVTATGEPTDVRFKVSGAAIRHPRSVKRGTKVKAPLRLAFTDGAIQEQQLTLTAK